MVTVQIPFSSFFNGMGAGSFDPKIKVTSDALGAFNVNLI
jgi:hypothetical protein